MTISGLNKNTVSTWENYFLDGWERNEGRRQTRLFAQYFLDVVRLPKAAKTLLDVGCAMGDAAPEFHRRYPHLKLHGCDVSKVAIEVARKAYGEISNFTVGSFHE